MINTRARDDSRGTDWIFAIVWTKMITAAAANKPTGSKDPVQGAITRAGATPDFPIRHAPHGEVVGYVLCGGAKPEHRRVVVHVGRIVHGQPKRISRLARWAASASVQDPISRSTGVVNNIVRICMAWAHRRSVPIPASTYRMTELTEGKEYEPADQDDETDRRQNADIQRNGQDHENQATIMALLLCST
jgi:hypothetical protein